MGVFKVRTGAVRSVVNDQPISPNKESRNYPFPFPLPPSPWRRALSLVAVPSIHRSNSAFGTRREKERDKKRFSSFNGNGNANGIRHPSDDGSDDNNGNEAQRSEDKGQGKGKEEEGSLRPYSLNPDLPDADSSDQSIILPPQTVRPLPDTHTNPYLKMNDGESREDGSRYSSKSRSLSLSLPFSIPSTKTDADGGAEGSMINHYSNSKSSTMGTSTSDLSLDRDRYKDQDGDEISIDTSRSIPQTDTEFQSALDGDSPKHSFRSDSGSLSLTHLHLKSNSNSGSDMGSDSTVSRGIGPSHPPQVIPHHFGESNPHGYEKDHQQQGIGNQPSLDTLAHPPVPQNSLSSIEIPPAPSLNDQQRVFTPAPTLPPHGTLRQGLVEVIPRPPTPCYSTDQPSSIDLSEYTSAMPNENSGSPHSPTATQAEAQSPFMFNRSRDTSIAPFLPLPPSPPPTSSRTRSPSIPFPFLPFPYLPRSPPGVIPNSIHAPSPGDYIPRVHPPTSEQPSSDTARSNITPISPSYFPPVPPPLDEPHIAPPIPTLGSEFAPSSTVPPTSTSPTAVPIPSPADGPGYFPIYPLPYSGPIPPRHLPLLGRPPHDVPHIVWLPFPPNGPIPPPPIPRFSQGRPLDFSPSIISHGPSANTQASADVSNTTIPPMSTTPRPEPSIRGEPTSPHLAGIERELYELSFPTPTPTSTIATATERMMRIDTPIPGSPGERPRHVSEGGRRKSQRGYSRLPILDWTRRVRLTKTAGHLSPPIAAQRPKPNRGHLSTMANVGSEQASIPTPTTPSIARGDLVMQDRVIWDEIHNDPQGDFVIAHGNKRWKIAVDRFKNDSELIYHLSLPPIRGKNVTLTIPDLPQPKGEHGSTPNLTIQEYDPITLFLNTLLTHDESFVSKLSTPEQIESVLVLSDYFISPHITTKIVRYLQTQTQTQISPIPNLTPSESNSMILEYGWELFIISSKFNLLDLAKVALESMDHSPWCPLRNLGGMRKEDIQDIRKEWVLELIKRRFRKMVDGKYEEMSWGYVARWFNP